jgi:hypothetical protein
MADKCNDVILSSEPHHHENGFRDYIYRRRVSVSASFQPEITSQNYLFPTDVPTKYSTVAALVLVLYDYGGLIMGIVMRF